MGTQVKQILLLALWFLVMLPGTIKAQPGFDRIYNYCNSQIQSRYRTVLADSQRIVFAGVARRDSITSACGSDISFIGAYDYSGNLLWKKQLHFTNPVFQGNEVIGANSLIKVAPNRYALTLNGYQCDSVYSMSRSAIYIFNANGDSLGFLVIPANANEYYASYAIKADAQHNILISGTYTYNGTDSSLAWLAKFAPGGQLLWEKKLTGGNSIETYTSYVEKILVGNRPGEYVLSGGKLFDSTSNNTNDAFWKTDTAGNILWQRNLPKYSNWVESYETTMQITEIINASNGSGYYFATAGPKPFHFPGEDPSYRIVYYCGKLDEDGRVVWAKIYEIDTMGDAGSLNIVQQKNGDLLILGVSGDIMPPDESGANLICTDSLGHVKWLKMLRHFNCPNGQPEQTLNSISLAPNGGIVMAGGMSQVGLQPGCWDTIGSIAWLIYTDSLGRLNANDTVTRPIHEEDVHYDPTAIAPTVVNNNAFRIYPNPAKDNLHVVLSGVASAFMETDYSMYDYTGKMVLQGKMTGASGDVNIVSLPFGIYLIRLSSKDKDWGVQKIVKQ